MSSASGQKLFCEVFSVFKCSFDEFVGEKVVSPSYSSAILAPPPAYKVILMCKYLFFFFFLIISLEVFPDWDEWVKNTNIFF